MVFSEALAKAIHLHHSLDWLMCINLLLAFRFVSAQIARGTFSSRSHFINKRPGDSQGCWCEKKAEMSSRHLQRWHLNRNCSLGSTFLVVVIISFAKRRTWHFSSLCVIIENEEEKKTLPLWQKKNKKASFESSQKCAGEKTLVMLEERKKIRNNDVRGGSAKKLTVTALWTRQKKIFFERIFCLKNFFFY